MKRGFTLVELLVVIVIIGLLAALLVPAVIPPLCLARQANAKVLIGELTRCCVQYRLDKNVYPKGDGKGSSEMAEALSLGSSKHQPFFEFQDDMLDSGGNVRSPIRPMSQIIYYRNNGDVEKGKRPADAMNKRSVDLWCSDCNEQGGVENRGCNNWE